MVTFFFRIIPKLGEEKNISGEKQGKKDQKETTTFVAYKYGLFFWQMIVFFSDFMLEILVFEFGDGFFFRS